MYVCIFLSPLPQSNLWLRWISELGSYRQVVVVCGHLCQHRLAGRCTFNCPAFSQAVWLPSFPSSIRIPQVFQWSRLLAGKYALGRNKMLNKLQKCAESAKWKRTQGWAGAVKRQAQAGAGQAKTSQRHIADTNIF